LTTTREKTPKVAKDICYHEHIRKVSFTGSTAVGKIIASNCADFVKKTQLELGGNAPFIIFNSADIDKAVAGVMACKFRCSGQTCICANRILVQEQVYDLFVQKLAIAMKEQLHVGDGLNEKTTQGPLINQRAVEKVFLIFLTKYYYLM
jgi:acyl-CoA reductase-like NAD-dependent aldehyde dehydrogenase